MTDVERRSFQRSPAAETAAAVDEQIRGTIRHMLGMWIRLAEGLHRFNRSKLWRDLGYQSFEAYLDEPELGIERRWAYDLISMYEQLVVQRGVPVEELAGVRSSKVREVLPAIRRGQVTVDEALADCRVLSRADLEVRYRGTASATPGVPDVDSTVRTENEPKFRPELPRPPAPEPQPEVLEPRNLCPTCGKEW